MPQQSKLSKHNTKILHEGLNTVIVLYSTRIVTITPESVILNTGGYNTATIKTRMNQAAHQFHMNYHVYSKKGEWFAVFGQYRIIMPFKRNKLWMPRHLAEESIHPAFIDLNAPAFDTLAAHLTPEQE